MVITSAAGTHVGKIRKNNEDNYFLNGIYKTDCSENIRNDESEDQKARNIYAVCDGVGGEDAGELAALLAVEMLPEYESKDILNYIKEANEGICNAIREHNGTRMGTTLALLAIEDRTAEIYNIGDSRIYLFRTGSLQQLSKDHTKVQMMIDAGMLEQCEARNSKQRHIITQHLGIFPQEFIISPYIVRNIPVVAGDIFILCSDGLTDMMDDSEIIKVLTNNADDCPEKIVNELISGSLDKGGKDNVTVVVVKVE